ncbi:MAG: hemerythrin family protein [Nitrospinae bacterium]|nr:hemerythrin family protein [Nitrospinota bacterium]
MSTQFASDKPETGVKAMSKQSWDMSYSVGVAKFDDQHKVLFEYLNQMHDAIRTNPTAEAIGVVLEGLVNYTLTHFFDEEIELMKNGYPDYERHREEHDKLVSAARDFVVRFKTGKSTPRRLTVEIIAVLTEWLKDHIMVADKRYSDFLNARGVK